MNSNTTDKLIDRLLIVGIPRSGSTLMAALVDSLENSLCLSEPEELFIPPSAKSKAEYVHSVLTALDRYRERILQNEIILDKRNADGSPITNYMKRRLFGGGRIHSPSEGKVDTSRYDADMLVAIKHNVPFLSTLPELVSSGIQIIGIVRHPIPTILSWHETNLPVSRGFMPSAEAFWPMINNIMNESTTPEIGWAKIYEAFYVRLRDANIPILKYEDLTTNISVLEEITGRKSISKVTIQKQDWKRYSGYNKLLKITQALSEHAPNATTFYPLK